MEELDEVSEGVVWEVDLGRRFCGLQNGVGVTSCLILLLYCFSFNDFVVDGNLEVDELNVTITSGMVTTLSYRMGCCRGYYP